MSDKKIIFWLFSDKKYFFDTLLTKKKFFWHFSDKKIIFWLFLTKNNFLTLCLQKLYASVVTLAVLWCFGTSSKIICLCGDTGCAVMFWHIFKNYMPLWWHWLCCDVLAHLQKLYASVVTLAVCYNVLACLQTLYGPVVTLAVL